METQQMTFEEINLHIEKAELSPFQKIAPEALRTEKLEDVLQKICGIYQIVKPILSAICLLPILPAKWKTAVKTFMGLLDGICTQH